MDDVLEATCDDMLPLPMRIGEEQNQWPPHTNAITYELRKGKGVVEETPALAVTTRARRGDAPLEVGIGEQGNYSSDEELNLSELERVAKRATKDVERGM
jgi:hypothetical protein